MSERTLVGPLLQVLRRIELHLLTHGQHHNPALCALVPEHLRVAEVGHVERQHRVARILRERASAIRAVGNALRLVAPCRSVHRNDGTRTEARRVVLVNHRAAAEDTAQRVRLNGIRQLLPVHQVARHAVAPRHVLPLRTVGVQLEVQVPLAILIEHTVRIVHPSIFRRVVICRTEALAVLRVESCRQLHLLPAGEVLHRARLVAVGREHNVEQELLVSLVLKTERNEVVHLVNGQLHVEALHHMVVAHHVHVRVLLFLLYGQQQVSAPRLHPQHGVRVAQVFRCGNLCLCAGACHHQGSCGNKKFQVSVHFVSHV